LGQSISFLNRGMEEYSIERFEKSKIKDLLYLFEATGRHNVYAADFERKFETMPLAGLEYVGFMAYHTATNEPAAFYGVFPCQMTIENKQVLVAQSGDTVTHPNHQKKGLFILLANKTYALCAALNIKLVFGFPNDNSQHGFFNKLEWKRLPMLKLYQLKRNSFWVKAFRYFGFMNALVNAVIIRLNKIDFTENRLPDYEVTKDKAYIAYKSTGSHFFSRLNGITMWLSIDKYLEIGLLRFSDLNAEGIEIVKTSVLHKFFVNEASFLYFGKDNDLVAKLFGEGKDIVHCGYRLIDKAYAFDDSKLSFCTADFDTF